MYGFARKREQFGAVKNKKIPSLYTINSVEMYSNVYTTINSEFSSSKTNKCCVGNTKNATGAKKE